MGARRLEGAAPTKVLSPATLTRRWEPAPKVCTAPVGPRVSALWGWC